MIGLDLGTAAALVTLTVLAALAVWRVRALVPELVMRR